MTTSLLLSAGRLRLKLLLFHLLCLLFFGVALASAFHRFLDLPEDEIRRQIALTGALVTIIFASIAGFAWVYLSPVARILALIRDQGGALLRRPHALEEKARRAALRFPLASITLGLCITTLAVFAAVCKV